VPTKTEYDEAIKWINSLDDKAWPYVPSLEAEAVKL
jgi:hypothetical protein